MDADRFKGLRFDKMKVFEGRSISEIMDDAEGAIHALGAISSQKLGVERSRYFAETSNKIAEELAIFNKPNGTLGYLHAIHELLLLSSFLFVHADIMRKDIDRTAEIEKLCVHESLKGLTVKSGAKRLFVNSRHAIWAGSAVMFEVENQSLWKGDSIGILDFTGNCWVIRTKNSGDVTIGQGHDAYVESIRPIE